MCECAPRGMREYIYDCAQSATYWCVENKTKQNNK